MSNWTSRLNAEQMQAVLHRDGPLLILAGAGSGKTTVLVSRAGQLIETGVSARSLMVLTFTNKAARELKHRVNHRLGEQAKGLWAGTFHSWGLQLLKKNARAARLPEKFGVIDQTDATAILKDLLRNLTVGGKDKFDLERLLNLVQVIRLQGRLPQSETDEYGEVATVLAPKFNRRLELLGVVDFDGLLLRPLALLRENEKLRDSVRQSIQYLMVDEFQDTNALQMELIDELLSPARNIAVVGDDDQAIYGFRGAEVHHILQFPKRYEPCQVIRLERNYRSSEAILRLANRVIAQNKHRHGKVLKSQKALASNQKPEVFTFENEEEEAEAVLREIRELRDQGLQCRDIAVLYRSNSQSALIESQLRQNQIPYSVTGGTSLFDRKEIKDVMAFLRFTLHQSDLSLRRILNLPPRGIGDQTFERIDEFSNQHHLSFFRACQRANEISAIAPQTTEAIAFFLQNALGLSQSLTESAKVGDALLEYLQQIGYRQYLYEQASAASSGEKKWVLMEIFARIMNQASEKYPDRREGLEEFLNRMELRDDPNDSAERDEVSLMTLHASKGLEFKAVFLIGVEEDLLPHRTLGENIDEERRLFYVGLTRAQERLWLSHCRFRRRYGSPRPVAVSRFLHEIPEDHYTKYADGVRPWSDQDRVSKLAEFYKKFEKGPGPRV